MAIRATDNEAYATELWGDNKRWDDNQKQYVPTEDQGAERDQPQPVDAPVDQGSGQAQAKPRKATAAKADSRE